MHFVISDMGPSNSKIVFPVNFLLMLIACGYCSVECDPPTGLTVPAILTNGEQNGRLL